ncbi:MAG: hypothetical protein M1814_004524 [Vezdaea aestivalis]|nr:MAG: hypothetical protein M1814_004524 [Vezdaea aestivalis]
MLAAPGSPPELEVSKSSKSSSFNSLRDRNDDFADISNFEDIGLDDSHHPVQNHRIHDPSSASWAPNIDFRRSPSFNGLSKPPVKSTRSVSSSNGDHQRELVGKRNLQSAPTRASGNVAFGENRRLGLPQGARRGFTSPSTPSLQMTMFRKRSPSPNARVHPPTSPLSPKHLGDGLPSVESLSKAVPVPSQRRRSWQPNKKTVKELEDECQDSDDDVPDDAVIWNVPISPLPPEERQSSPYPSISPNRKSSSPSTPRSIQRRSVTAFVPSGDRANPLRPPPLASPSKPAFERGVSTSASLRGRPGFSHKARAKSWNVALSDLSEEAKTLTEALEVHADSTGNGYLSATGSRRSRPNTPEKHRSKSVIVELPPLNKGNIMIDPLPISKEKEAVLTRTRPSWLPPKDPKEEKKHLKEYQKMMVLSQENERKRVAAEEQQTQELEAQMSSLSKIWEHHVLPNWYQSVSEPRTRELWWRGIASQSRGEVWSRALGNELSLTDASYLTALKRARNISQDIEDNKAQGIADARISREGAWFAAIRRDAETAWPKTGLFGESKPLGNHLVDVCMAYAAYRSDVGYIYGTHLIAALLLLNMSPEQAFSSLANLLNRPLPLSFLTGEHNGIARTYSITLSMVEYKYPRLHCHLFSTLKLSPEEVLEPLFRTLFCAGTGGTVGLEEASRLWDIMVFEGDKAAIRGAVGVLGALERRILGRDESEVRALLGWGWEGPDEIRKPEEVEHFISAVREAGKEDKCRSSAPPET